MFCFVIFNIFSSCPGVNSALVRAFFCQESDAQGTPCTENASLRPKVGRDAGRMMDMVRREPGNSPHRKGTDYLPRSARLLAHLSLSANKLSI